MYCRGVPHRFNAEEWAGAVGDFGTLLPIAFGVSMVSGLSLSAMLFSFGAAYIFTGLYYRLPMPVEPMKAIGVVAIAGSLSAAQVVASGFLMGAFLLVLGFAGVLGRIRGVVRRRVIRGVQLGLGLLLARSAWGFLQDDILLALGACLIILSFVLLRVRDISSLVVLGLGLVVGISAHGFPTLGLALPIAPVGPQLMDFIGALYDGVLPQIPLTVANAIFATSLLASDLLGVRIPNDRMAKTMGGMCLASSLLGGMPMCHGSGGLAAQYRFGARTGGSNLISGAILLSVALFAATPHTLLLVPSAVLGALLLFSSAEIFKASLKTDGPLVTLLIGVVTLLTNLGIAFLAGLCLDVIMRRLNDNKGGSVSEEGEGPHTV